VIVTPTAPSDDHTDMLQACEIAGARWVRGRLFAAEGDGSIRTVNHLALDQYLQGVVPSESPASWPAAALQAQAVAARSYGWSENRYTGYAKTCDTTICQVYGGVLFQAWGNPNSTAIEQASTNAAVAATSGQVRILGGAVAHTEFSSSTGGYSAGGTFPAVVDDGDADASNPNHTWNASIPVTSIQNTYPSIGTLQSIEVTKRNGFGEWGGRATEVVVHGSNGDVTISGSSFQSSFGLKSTWFLVTNNPSGGLVGYWVTASDGGVFTFGGAQFYGSTGAMRLNKPVVGMAARPQGDGYWLVASDGGVFTFGGASFFGSTGAMRLNKPIVGMAAAPGGDGYWLVASDGGIFTFGGARFFGSTGAMRLNKPIVGMAATPGGDGYWLVASDGGIFTFGSAPFFGSTGAMRLNSPIVGMAARPQGDGYWLLGGDGGIFTFGNAGYAGSLLQIGVAGPAVATEATATGGGYLIVTGNGRVYPFGDAPRFGGVPDQVPNYHGSVLDLAVKAGP
jgi:SpoIID/LytB domain protein